MARPLLAVLALAGLLPALVHFGEGEDLVGKPCPDWPDRRWLKGGPLQLADLRGKVVLVRFFTGASCPYCSETAPALNLLDRELGPAGLVIVGMYTPKPRPAPTTPEEVLRIVERYAFRFPVALDDDWGALKRLWLDRVEDAQFTSASLLMDRAGIVRFVHPGGALGPDAADPEARAEFERLRAMILRLIAEPRFTPSGAGPRRP